MTVLVVFGGGCSSRTWLPAAAEQLQLLATQICFHGKRFKLAQLTEWHVLLVDRPRRRGLALLSKQTATAAAPSFVAVAQTPPLSCPTSQLRFPRTKPKTSKSVSKQLLNCHSARRRSSTHNCTTYRQLRRLFLPQGYPREASGTGQLIGHPTVRWHITSTPTKHQTQTRIPVCCSAACSVQGRMMLC